MVRPLWCAVIAVAVVGMILFLADLAWRLVFRVPLDVVNLRYFVDRATSPAALTTFFAIFLIVTFQKELSRLIDRVKKVTGPSGTSLETGALQSEREEEIEDEPVEILPETDWYKTYLEEQLGEKEAEAAQASRNAEYWWQRCTDLETELEESKRKALEFEFRFLNLFLVPRTKVALRILAASPGLSLEHAINELDKLYGVATSNEERGAMFNALTKNDLAAGFNGTPLLFGTERLTVTTKGHGFLAWIGPIG